jgi:hypothetical protein
MAMDIGRREKANKDKRGTMNDEPKFNPPFIVHRSDFIVWVPFIVWF